MHSPQQLLDKRNSIVWPAVCFRPRKQLLLWRLNAISASRCKTSRDRCRNVKKLPVRLTLTCREKSVWEARSWKRQVLLPRCLHGPDAEWVKANTASENEQESNVFREIPRTERTNCCLPRSLTLSLAEWTRWRTVQLEKGRISAPRVRACPPAPEVGQEKMSRFLCRRGSDLSLCCCFLCFLVLKWLGCFCFWPFSWQPRATRTRVTQVQLMQLLRLRPFSDVVTSDNFPFIQFISDVKLASFWSWIFYFLWIIVDNSKLFRIF